jgi:hypothetical protein
VFACPDPVELAFERVRNCYEAYDYHPDSWKTRRPTIVEMAFSDLEVRTLATTLTG